MCYMLFRVATLPPIMVQAESPSMERSLLMKTSKLNIQRQACYLWLMLDQVYIYILLIMFIIFCMLAAHSLEQCFSHSV
jgi:hypothetical protein